MFDETKEKKKNISFECTDSQIKLQKKNNNKKKKQQQKKQTKQEVPKRKNES